MRGAKIAIGIWFVLVSACAAEPHCAAPSRPGLAEFHAALGDLRQGRRKTVAVLHLGDSHIALDYMTDVPRARLAGLFGDAGRALPPGVPYRYYAPAGYSVTMTGPWEVASSLQASTQGPFGIAGYRIVGTSPAAETTIERQAGGIATVEVDAMGGPRTGSLMLTIDGAAPLRLSTRRPTPGLVRLRVPAASARRVALNPAGDGEVTLLGWTLLTGKPGIRYDSYGITGVTLDVVDRWDAATVDRQIETLAPDLVILGYGTNEGFNDGLGLRAYAVKLDALIARLKRLSPRASIVVLGSLDGARKAKPGIPSSCGDGWTTPPKLDALREVQRSVAEKRSVAYVDLSIVMDGRCGIDRWVNAEPPLAWPDHVHLRPEGARRAGAFLTQMLAPAANCSAR